MNEKTVKLEDVTCDQLWSRTHQHLVCATDMRASPLDYAEHDLVTTEPDDDWVVMPGADEYLERAAEVIYDNVRIDDSGDFYRFSPGAKEALQQALDTWASDYLQQDTLHIATDVRVKVTGEAMAANAVKLENATHVQVRDNKGDDGSGDAQFLRHATTTRGFKRIDFCDSYGVSCSLQQSSNVEPHIWLGVDEAKPEVMCSDAQKVGLGPSRNCGWMPYPIPSEVHIGTRMHLTPEMAAELWPLLRSFAEAEEAVKLGATGPDISWLDEYPEGVEIGVLVTYNADCAHDFARWDDLDPDNPGPHRSAMTPEQIRFLSRTFPCAVKSIRPQVEREVSKVF